MSSPFTLKAQNEGFIPKLAKESSEDGRRALAIFRLSISNNPPIPKKSVNDWENILTTSEKSYLDSLISTVKKKQNIDIGVLTLDSAYCKIEKYETFVTRIADRWGIGKKATKNGVLIILCTTYNDFRISSGYGDERLIPAEPVTYFKATELQQTLDNKQYFLALQKAVLFIASYTSKQ